MAGNLNTSSPQAAISASIFGNHGCSLQPEAQIASSSGMILLPEISGRMNNSNVMMDSIDSHRGTSNRPDMLPSGSSPPFRMLLDTVPGLSQETVLSSNWSSQELSVLEEGLAKFSKETSFTQYIKIAAMLPNKTIRDVALRCQWMKANPKKDRGKRRRLEEYCTGVKEKKERLMECSPKANIPQALPGHVAPCSFTMQNVYPNDHLLSYEVGGASRQLLEENARILDQITINLESFQITENLDLFCRARNNITAILSGLKNMTGTLSQMPPLPVSLNEELANIIALSRPQVSINAGIYNLHENCKIEDEGLLHFVDACDALYHSVFG